MGGDCGEADNGLVERDQRDHLPRLLDELHAGPCGKEEVFIVKERCHCRGCQFIAWGQVKGFLSGGGFVHDQACGGANSGLASIGTN